MPILGGYDRFIRWIRPLIFVKKGIIETDNGYICQDNIIFLEY